jgi:hypothetical protein
MVEDAAFTCADLGHLLGKKAVRRAIKESCSVDGIARDGRQHSGVLIDKGWTLE